MANNIPNLTEIIDIMIDLRVQSADIEAQIKAIKPAVFAACAMQDTKLC